MTQLAENRKVSHAAAWIGELRQSGSARFDHVGFPNSKQESWRFTNIAPIAKTNFAAALAVRPDKAHDSAVQFSLGGDTAAELVFVNGHYLPQLSHPGKLPHSVTMCSLAEALVSNLAELQLNLGQLAEIDTNPFVAMNTGSLHDGAFIHLPRGTVIDGPIHLLFISIGEDQPTVSHPRVLIVAEENVQATIVESYVGQGDGVYFTNAVTEIVAGQGSRIDHCKLQQETHRAYHVSTTQVNLARSAQFVSHVASLGAALCRNDLNVILGGEHADATLNGLVLLDGNRHCDNHTLLDHAAANCPSHELYKHVLAGKSTGVFKGQILVRPDSQKTDAKQTSKTLLLSDDAMMNSMPALEIYADDVKCTHGSTTGPVDEEQVFYLRSRGVGHEAARHLLTYAFAADITRRIRVAPVRARIENFMAAQHGLPQDLRIADLGAHDEAVVNL